MSHRATTPSRSLPTLVAVTLWVYQRLLFLHPPAFRRAFGAPITQVFQQVCLDAHQANGMRGVVRLWLPALGDVLRSALAEHAAPLARALKGSPPMLQYRRSASVIFAAFIAFVVAGIGFAKMSEVVMKSSLPTTHPLFAITYVAVEIGSIVSLLAILVGGIPIAVAALRFALAHRRRDILARFAVPPLALLAIGAYFLIAIVFHPKSNISATLHLPLWIGGFGFIGVFLIGAAASTIAVLNAIARSEIDEHLLRFTLFPGALATVAMLGMAVACVIWGIGLWQNDPALFWGNDGILATSTLLSTLIQVLLMVAAVLIATRAVFQGLATRRATQHLA